VVGSVRAVIPPVGYLKEGTDLPRTATPKGATERW
jgi:hypothetical protein